MITRLDRFRSMVDRAKLLRRRGIVLTTRDLEELVALVDAAREVATAEEDPGMTGDLCLALAAFDELTDPN